MIDFSIIMPCYNAEETLGRAITSVLAQSHTSWELICVNDGSRDRTAAMLHEWELAEPNIRVIHTENRGPSVARNLGATAADGEILCFLDADDIWVSHKLAQLFDLFKDPNVGGAFGEISFFETPEQEITRSTVPNGPLTIPMLMGENPVCTMSNFSLRADHFHDCGGLAAGLVHNEDLEWLIRLVGMGVQIQPIADRHVWYRTSRGGLSADLIAMAKSRRVALRTALYFGHRPKAAQEAIYLRYLARRALRLQDGAETARSFALKGLKQNPAAFLWPPKRGVATAVAALAAPNLPTQIKRSLLS